MCVSGCFCVYSSFAASGTFGVVNLLVSNGQKAHKERKGERKTAFALVYFGYIAYKSFTLFSFVHVTVQ